MLMISLTPISVFFKIYLINKHNYCFEKKLCKLAYD